MASKQTEELNKLYLEWVAALKGNPEMPLDEIRHMFEQWPRITGEPGGVDYIETDAGGVPAMWAAPKTCAQYRVLLCAHGGGYVDWYRRIFPTRLSPERQAASEFETTAQGCRIATSIGGGLTGRGADLIILDDPLKPEEALSQTRRRATNEWFDHTLYSRLNDKENGAIILIKHRLHERVSSGLTRGTIWSARY